MLRKLHLGNGTIYLKDYINVDLKLDHHYLALVRPDLVEKNTTTVDNYYKEDVTQETIEDKSRQFREVVCDLFADIKDLPFQENSMDEIRTCQVFEHFTYYEGKQLLQNWMRILKPGGVVHIDIPDLDGTIQLYNEAKTIRERDWAVRLLMGSQKNEYGIHKGMYNKDMIKEILEEMGYVDVKFGKNIHFYPAFSVEAVKPNV
jgi:predicted SAM-dependent methyltransferase